MGIGGWLARRSGSEISVYLGFWLLLGAMAILHAFRLIPAFLVLQSGTTYKMTTAGGIAFLVLWLGPPIAAMIARRRAQAALVVDHKEGTTYTRDVENVRFERMIWRSGVGTILLVFFWLAVSPFALWMLAFIAKITDPERATLTKDSPYVWLGVVILLAPVVLLVQRWIRSRRWVAAEVQRLMPPPPPRSMSRGERLRSAVVAAFCFLVAGGFVAAMVFAVRPMRENIRRARSSESWPRVPGVITTSELVNGSNPDGETGSRAVIRYTYVVNDTPHVGFLTWLPLSGDPRRETISYGSTASAVMEIQNYPLGDTVLVAYDPADPSLATLNTGASVVALGGTGGMFVFIGGFALICAAIGVAVLVPALRKGAPPEKPSARYRVR